MLIKCQACGNATSDAAARCPKCGSSRETFLGTARPCYECGALLAPAYPTCGSCGAPAADDIVEQTNADRSESVEAEQPSEAIAPPSSNFALLNDPEPKARGDDHNRSTAEPIYIKLTAVGHFASPLRVWLIVYSLILGGQAALLIGIGWVTSDYSEAYFSRQDLDRWLDMIASAAPLLTAATTLALAVCAYYYCRFLFRALQNLRPVSKGNSTWNPTWGVVMHFIPFVNLFAVMPMIDAWNGAHYVAKQPAAANGAIGAWWTFWLISAIMNGIGNALVEFPDQYPNALRFSIGGTLAGIFAALLLRNLVKRIADTHDSARIPIDRVVEDDATQPQT